MTQVATLRRWQARDVRYGAFCVVILMGMIPIVYYTFTSLRAPAVRKHLPALPKPTKRTVLRNMCNASKEIPRVLFWTQKRVWNLSSENEVEVPSCKQRCHVTYNRDYLDCSDAVVFHARDLSLEDLPAIRHSFQKWVFYSRRAPPYSYDGDYDRLNSLFNWTMTYRSDSDVPLSIGTFRRKTTSTYKKNLKAIWMRKKKTAVFVSSVCKANSKREDFVNELQKYTDVDVYGDCGLWEVPSSSNDASLRYYSKDYYFWLALEDSLCREYVTSPLISALKHDIVPVALGSANYSAITPPHSVVDVSSFASPKLLADYLQEVKMDLNLYSAYFQWKNSYDAVVEDETFCSLCVKLHTPEFKTFSSYDNLHSWWVNKSDCTQWNDTAWNSARREIVMAGL